MDICRERMLQAEGLVRAKPQGWGIMLITSGNIRRLNFSHESIPGQGSLEFYGNTTVSWRAHTIHSQHRFSSSRPPHGTKGCWSSSHYAQVPGLQKKEIKRQGVGRIEAPPSG